MTMLQSEVSGKIREIETHLPYGYRVEMRIVNEKGHPVPVTVDLASTAEANVIMNAVAEVTGLQVDQIISRRRDREYTDARKIFVHLALGATRLTLKTLGGIMGRDHTTVIHMKRAALCHIANDESFQEKICQAKKKLNYE